MPENSVTCGQLLRHYRQLARLTQEEVAERSGYSADYLSKLERDQRQPPLVALDRLAGVLTLGSRERDQLRAAREQRQPAPAAEETGPRDWLPPVPLPPTALLGRNAELALIARLLSRPEVRLVTIVGPPGVGKTRLALEVAARRRADDAGGACFVDLAPLGDPDLVVPAIAQALGLRETAGRSLPDVLVAELRDRRLLLALDNFEQVLAAGPALAQLLVACPRLVVLATSRAPLRLRGEHEVPLSPLALPQPARSSESLVQPNTPDLAAVAQSPAVALFVERAAAVQLAFALTEENLRDVVEVCTRLDGLPLAIELAAARLRLLPLPALVERLTGRLDVLAILTGGPRDLPARQQTLRATIDWSYHLLDAADQRLFQRLGVFTGGFTLDAVESIVRSPKSEVNDDLGLRTSDFGLDVLEGLERLADASLLTRIEPVGGQPVEKVRFRLLETLREYGLERLEAGGEADDVHERHADFYVALAEQGQANLMGPEREVWLDRLEHDQANFRAALQWLTERGDVERALRLGAALSRFWHAWGYRAEGRDRLLALLSPKSEVLPLTRANALAAAATLVGYGMPAVGSAATGDGQAGVPTARALVQHAMTLWQELGAADEERRDGDKVRAQAIGGDVAGQGSTGPPATAQASAMLRAANYVQDSATACALVEQAVAIWRRLGDQYAVARGLSELALFTRDHGRHAAARGFLEESIALSRQLGDRRTAGEALSHLGTIEHVAGDLDAARRRYEASLVALQEADARALEAWPHLNLGFLALAAGDPAAARARALEVLAIRREHGPQAPLVHIFALCAAAAAAEGQPERALRLAGAVEVFPLRPPPRERNTWLPPPYQTWLDPWLAIARRDLDPCAAAAAEDEGVSMTAAQALAEITAYLDGEADPAESPPT